MTAKFVFEQLGFQRNSDPKAALGLGGYSFETLKNGTILKSKKTFTTSASGEIRTNTGFKGKLAGSFFIIRNLERISSYYISFNYINFGRTSYFIPPEERMEKEEELLEKVKMWRTQFFKNPTQKIYYTTGKIVIGKQKFNNLFKIIDPYFDNVY